MKLELGIMAGAESKAWLMELTKQIDRLEKLAGNFEGSKNGKAAEPLEDEAETGNGAADEDDEEDFTTAPAKKKPGRPKGAKNKTASFDEDDEEESESEEPEEAEAEEETDAIDVSKMKSGKTKKITLDMVNDAAKKLAAKYAKVAAKDGKKGRAHVLGILQKNFNTESISEIDESDYPKAMAVLAS